MKFHNPLIHRLLVIYLILQSPAPGLVLCWGDNDHFAIEISSMKDIYCLESSISDKKAVYVDEEVNDPLSSCFDCWDIPLAIQAHADFIFGARFEGVGVCQKIPTENVQSFSSIAIYTPHHFFELSPLSISISSLSALKSIRLII